MSKYISYDRLVLIEKNYFPLLEAYPIDADDVLYQRVLRLMGFYLFRAPLPNTTLLADESSINNYESSNTPATGSRAENRSAFDQSFLIPCSIDCASVDFAYTRKEMQPKLEEINLLDDSRTFFENPRERGVFYVGKPDGKEESCIQSVCRHIRNAFGHGRIAICSKPDGIYAYIEDGCNPRDVDYDGEKPDCKMFEIRARALIKLETLEKWQELLFKTEASK